MDKLDLWVQQAARSHSRAYSSWTTYDDVKQHLLAWTLSNRERVTNYLDNPDAERIIRSILNQEARNYCTKERAVSSGYSQDDVAWYSINALKTRLPDVFDYEDWQSFQAGGGGSPSNKPAAWSGDRLAEIIDIKSALAKLSDDNRAILKEHYGNGLTIEQCADLFEIKYDTATKRLARSLKYLSRQLNDPRPSDPMEGVTIEQWRKNQKFYDTRTSGRKAMSNAAARSATDTNWG